MASPVGSVCPGSLGRGLKGCSAAYWESQSRPSRTVMGDVSPLSSTAAHTRRGVGMARNMGWFFSCKARASSRGVPAARMVPRSITAARLARGRASSRRCSVSRTVTPSSRLSLARTPRKSEAAIGSSWLVGSSRMRSSGSRVITAARLRSCFCPPEREATSRWNQFWMPKKEAISATRRRIKGVSRPRDSRPKANSCQTLSVTS